MDLFPRSSPRARILLVSGVVLLGAGCGQGASTSSSPSPSPTSSSSSASASPSSGAPSSPSASPSSSGRVAADGRCGGGRFPTKVVKASDGVSMTVPASWKVVSAKAGAASQLTPPPASEGDGFLFVKQTSQTLDQAVRSEQRNAADGAEVVGQSTLDRPGLQARLTTFRYPSQGSTFSVSVVAVGGGVTVVANMTRSKDAAEQAAAESCLSSLQRGAS